MGMFDDIKCDYPLPGLGVVGTVFQSKSLDCLMWTYTITREGRLFVRTYSLELVPEDERPYPDMLSLGMFRAINERDVDTEYHGDICFYGDSGEFVARFTHGTLEWVKSIDDMPVRVVDVS